MLVPSFSFSLSHSLSTSFRYTLRELWAFAGAPLYMALGCYSTLSTISTVCRLYIGGFTIIYPICITVFWRRAHQITVLVWKSTPDNAPAISYHFVIDIRHRVPPNRPYSYSNSHHSSLLAFEAFNDFQVQLFVAEHWVIANGIIYGAYQEKPQVGFQQNYINNYKRNELIQVLAYSPLKTRHIFD